MPTNPVPLAAVVFGWPAVLASITVLLAGVANGRWRVVLTGGLTGCPFLLYLFGLTLALPMATPFFVLSAFVAWLVLRQ